MFKKIVFLVSVTALACGAATFCRAEEVPSHKEETAVEDDFLDLYETAVQCIKKKDYDRAIEVFDIILVTHPDDAQIHYLRGLLHHKLGKVGQAQRDYLFLVENQQADGTIYNNLGAIYASEGDMEEAYKWFTHALREDSATAEVHDNFAELYRQEKDYPEAVSEYKKVIALENDNTRALFNLGVTYAEMEDYAGAQQQWERVLELNPGDRYMQSVVAQVSAYRKEIQKNKDRKKDDEK